MGLLFWKPVIIDYSKKANAALQCISGCFFVELTKDVIFFSCSGCLLTS